MTLLPGSQSQLLSCGCGCVLRHFGTRLFLCQQQLAPVLKLGHLAQHHRVLKEDPEHFLWGFDWCSAINNRLQCYGKLHGHCFVFLRNIAAYWREGWIEHAELELAFHMSARSVTTGTSGCICTPPPHSSSLFACFPGRRFAGCRSSVACSKLKDVLKTDSHARREFIMRL